MKFIFNKVSQNLTRKGGEVFAFAHGLGAKEAVNGGVDFDATEVVQWQAHLQHLNLDVTMTFHADSTALYGGCISASVTLKIALACVSLKTNVIATVCYVASAAGNVVHKHLEHPRSKPLIERNSPVLNRLRQGFWHGALQHRAAFAAPCKALAGVVLFAVAGCHLCALHYWQGLQRDCVFAPHVFDKPIYVSCDTFFGLRKIHIATNVLVVEQPRHRLHIFACCKPYKISKCLTVIKLYSYWREFESNASLKIGKLTHAFAPSGAWAVASSGGNFPYKRWYAPFTRSSIHCVSSSGQLLIACLVTSRARAASAGVSPNSLIASIFVMAAIVNDYLHAVNNYF
jgi:hypothetical protein